MRQVVPTKAKLISLKNTLNLAIKGQQLMEKKKNILINELFSNLSKMNEIKSNIQNIFKIAYKSLQDSNITLGNIDIIAKASKIDDNINLSFKNVMGVDLPIVIYNNKNNYRYNYSISRTNSNLDLTYLNFNEVKKNLLLLAEIDNSTFKLANAINKSQKRANSLKNVVIPNLKKQIKQIENAIEEKEREEFIRLKIIKNKA